MHDGSCDAARRGWLNRRRTAIELENDHGAHENDGDSDHRVHRAIRPPAVIESERE